MYVIFSRKLKDGTVEEREVTHCEWKWWAIDQECERFNREEKAKWIKAYKVEERKAEATAPKAKKRTKVIQREALVEEYEGGYQE